MWYPGYPKCVTSFGLQSHANMAHDKCQQPPVDSENQPAMRAPHNTSNSCLNMSIAHVPLSSNLLVYDNACVPATRTKAKQMQMRPATECVLLLNTLVQICFQPATKVHPQDVMNQMVNESDVPLQQKRQSRVAALLLQLLSSALPNVTLTAAHAVMCDHTSANV
jgi:hypothetical protein